MIRFPCRCGHIFEEPDDASGSAIQCPNCMLLNDVPSHRDLEAIGLDGIYKVTPPEESMTPGTVGEMAYVFAKSKVDDNGNPIDLRNREDEMSEIGEPDTLETAQRRQRPRYDPETGELIRPIPLALPRVNTGKPSEIPFAKATIGYEPPPLDRPTAANMLLELARPHSIFVILFVYAIHLLTALTVAVTEMGLIFFAPCALAMIAVILAHFGNVVNETGPEERDELPRVLGDMRLYEDVWLPTVDVIAALLLCFTPVIVFAFLSDFAPGMEKAIEGFLLLIGVFFFPATALTLLTSGSISNLRPDRVLRVIAVAPVKYLGITLLFLLGLSSEVWAVLSLIIEALRIGRHASYFPHVLTQLPVALPLQLVGIFILHYFCCQLGLYYRANQARFGWVGQFYSDQPRAKLVRRRPRYVVPPGESAER